MIVCGGTRIRDVVDAGMCGMLTSIAGRGIPLGGICTGAYALMSSQLLDGYRCSIHWENRAALQDPFPLAQFADELFCVDRDRLTCTGGTAPIDMMLNLVGLRFRQRMAAQVAEQFILERIRGTTDVQPIPVDVQPIPVDVQPIPVDVRVGLLRAELIEVLRLMEVNIEEPLSLEELTRLVNLWQRHLQRMFKFYLNVSPTHYYLTLRLKRARDLLRTTNASIACVTTVCGFHSQCHFSKAYRAQFGYAPSHERRLPG